MCFLPYFWVDFTVIPPCFFVSFSFVYLFDIFNSLRNAYAPTGNVSLFFQEKCLSNIRENFAVEISLESINSSSGFVNKLGIEHYLSSSLKSEFVFKSLPSFYHFQSNKEVSIRVVYLRRCIIYFSG